MSGDAKTKGKAIKQILSANDLLEGDVVYRTEAGGWSRSIAEAAIATDAESAEALLKGGEAEPHLVVDAALAEVTIDEDGAVTPVAHRERIRALGPSNRLDLGKQAEASGSQGGKAEAA